MNLTNKWNYLLPTKYNYDNKYRNTRKYKNLVEFNYINIYNRLPCLIISVDVGLLIANFASYWLSSSTGTCMIKRLDIQSISGTVLKLVHAAIASSRLCVDRKCATLCAVLTCSMAKKKKQPNNSRSML